MGNDEDYSRGYIRGYKEGLLEAWNELVKLTAKGYSPRELQIIIKSAQPSLTQKVDIKVAEIERTLGRPIFSEERRDEAKTSLSVDMLPGMSICFKEERPEKGPRLAKAMQGGDVKLLSISRLHPDQVATQFGLSGTMIWLTKSEAMTDSSPNLQYVSPNSLPVLADEIQQFLSNNLGGIIFLEGLEYLYSQNDFKSVLRFIQLLSEQVQLKKGFLIVTANPVAMEAKEFSLIEREMSKAL